MISDAEKRLLYNAAVNYRNAMANKTELWEAESALLRAAQPDVIVRLIEHYDGLVPSLPPQPSEPPDTQRQMGTKGEISGAF